MDNFHDVYDIYNIIIIIIIVGLTYLTKHTRTAGTPNPGAIVNSLPFSNLFLLPSSLGIERLHVDDNQLNDRICNQKNIVKREIYKEGMRALDTHPEVMQIILSHAAHRQRDLSRTKRPNSATSDEGTEVKCKKTCN